MHPLCLLNRRRCWFFTLIPYTLHFTPITSLTLVVQILQEDYFLLLQMRRYQYIYLDMTRNIYLCMAFKIIFHIAREIMLEITVFEFYSNHPFPIWWWLFEAPLLSSLLQSSNRLVTVSTRLPYLRWVWYM